MPVLKNSRHERFCQAVASGMTAVAAYMKAYSCSIENAECNASRLRDSEGVAERIAEIMEAGAEFVSLNRGEWLESFVRIAGKAEKSKDFSAARASLRELGLAMPGWYAPEESKVNLTTDTHKSAVARIRKRKITHRRTPETE
jgi:hypothetical protein